MKKGLVLEGGAMRGLFTAGIIDVMMGAGVEPDGLIGVSAGAAFGCNYKSRQPGRAIRYNTRFAKDPRYSGLRSLIKSGDYFNAEFGYHIVPKQYDIFDVEAFEQGQGCLPQDGTCGLRRTGMAARLGLYAAGIEGGGSGRQETPRRRGGRLHTT